MVGKGHGASGGDDGRTDIRDIRVETPEGVHLNYRTRAYAYYFRMRVRVLQRSDWMSALPSCRRLIVRPCAARPSQRSTPPFPSPPDPSAPCSRPLAAVLGAEQGWREESKSDIDRHYTRRPTGRAIRRSDVPDMALARCLPSPKVANIAISAMSAADRSCGSQRVGSVQAGSASMRRVTAGGQKGERARSRGKPLEPPSGLLPFFEPPLVRSCSLAFQPTPLLPFSFFLKSESNFCSNVTWSWGTWGARRVRSGCRLVRARERTVAPQAALEGRQTRELNQRQGDTVSTLT